MDRIICENCGREYENILGACPECGHVNEAVGSDTPQSPTGGMEQQIFTIPLTPRQAPAATLPPEPEANPLETEAQAPAARDPDEPEATDEPENASNGEPTDQAAPARTDEFTITPRQRVREEKYRVPTWALGAVCCLLGVVIIVGIVFIASNLKRLNQDPAAQDQLLAEEPAAQTTDPAATPAADQSADQSAQDQTAPTSDETPGDVTPATEPVEEPAEPAVEDLVCQSISLDKSDVTLMQTGESFTITATVFPVALGEQVTWTSSNETLLSVDEQGVVVALGGIRGEAVTVTAACQEKSASCVVRFGFSDDPTILQLNYADVTLPGLGDTLDLNVTSQLTESESGQVFWLSDNPAVAVVDGDGVITAIASGTATVTATLGSRVGSCIIRVK